ncbi:MAG: crotonase/enoyl-CoA hydratase family protein [Rhizobacter sp.]|nr:crotonase/enoyl-CoA hydratase family protein [Rhizobacter sp.]
MNPSLAYQLEDGIATITIDDGKANVMSVAMLGAIADALQRAETDRAIVVVQGRPGMFSAGFDLTVFKRDKRELFEMLKAGAELTERMLSFPHPIVVVCTGHAIAMGAFMLLCADVRIGSDADAKVQANEVQIGLTLPHFAVEVCRQRLAPAHFNLAAGTAAPYSQQQAVAAGFLDEVSAPVKLADALERRIAHLRSLNADAFAATKLRSRGPGLVALRSAIAMDIEDWSHRIATGA